jgi:multiple sugar transport system substrate-binding protein
MKCFLNVAVLFTMILFAGCTGKNAPVSGSSLNADFFKAEIKGEITVSAYESWAYRNFLEEAVKLFEERYPDTKVNIETFSAMPEVRSGGQGGMQISMIQVQNDPQSRTDYISRVNTNLMSGTGADIYAMDILPLHKFSASGTLENLEPYMEIDPEFNRDNYRRNILDALRYNNGTWFLPLDYSFNYFAYDSTLVSAQAAQNFSAAKAWTIDALIKMGMPLFDGTNKLFNIIDYGRRGGGIFHYLLNENIQSFVNLENKRTNFSDGRFSGLLESIKKYGEEGVIPKGITGQQDAGQLMQRAASAPVNRYFFKLNGNASLFSHFSRGAGQVNRIMTEGTQAGIEDDDEIAGIEANSEGSIPFRYTQAFGINAQSKNKAAAWAFLKFLLSDEMQLSTNSYIMSLPVNNKAREEKAELLFSGALSPFGGKGSPLNDQQRLALEKYRIAVEILSDNINSFVLQDTSLNDMISSEADYFFTGSRTSEETARVLQNKADLYLSE